VELGQLPPMITLGGWSSSAFSSELAIDAPHEFGRGLQQMTVESQLPQQCEICPSDPGDGFYSASLVEMNCLAV
jgi:hypothetical protein